jgi:hypothetical protein
MYNFASNHGHNFWTILIIKDVKKKKKNPYKNPNLILFKIKEFLNGSTPLDLLMK